MKIRQIYMFLWCFTLWQSQLLAGPTIIQDNRVTNLGTTPVLGRGYSVATNTFQSTCMKDVVLTEPSYDFTYSFEEMDDFLSSTSASENTPLFQIANSKFKNYLIKEGREAKDRQNRSLASSKDITTTETIKIVVNIQLDSYYASLDESNSSLSDSAVALIENRDLPGFFSACGPFYVRTIRRSAIFISVFEFDSTTEIEDRTFTHQLEKELKSFKKAIVAQEPEDTNTNEAPENTASQEELKDSPEDAATSSFYGVSTQRNLTITASAFGLGKNEKAALISYDIDSFKEAIKDAFLSMQNPRTGKVTSIEVMPWAENTEFQSLLGLIQETEAVDPEADEGSATLKRGKIISLYEKKYNLNQNAEFLAEIERSDRALMNIYYKAKICRKYIDTNWKEIRGSKRELKGAYLNRWVMNNRSNNTGILLSELDTGLSKQKIDKLLLNHRQFMYGGGIWGAGATDCINTLSRYDLFRVNFHNIESCTLLEENLVQLEDEFIENHCMPVLINKGLEPTN